MSHAQQWSDRIRALADDPHLRDQVARLMEPLRLIRGTKDTPAFDDVVLTAAQLVALLETKPELAHTANVGGLMAVRGPFDGYALLVHAADVFVSRLSSYEEAARYWRAGQEARAADAESSP